MRILATLLVTLFCLASPAQYGTAYKASKANSSNLLGMVVITSTFVTVSNVKPENKQAVAITGIATTVATAIIIKKIKSQRKFVRRSRKYKSR